MSKPINIFTSKISSGDKKPDDLNSEYYYNLTLFYQEESKEFTKYTSNKYCQLICFSKKISSKKIKYFTLEIKEVPFINNNISIQEDLNFDEFNDNFIYRDESIYLEIVLDGNDNLSVTCNLSNISSKILVTPPNY